MGDSVQKNQEQVWAFKEEKPITDSEEITGCSKEIITLKKKKTSGTSNSKGPDFSPLPSNIYLYYKTAIMNKNATHTLKIQ